MGEDDRKRIFEDTFASIIVYGLNKNFVVKLLIKGGHTAESQLLVIFEVKFLTLHSFIAVFTAKLRFILYDIKDTIDLTQSPVEKCSSRMKHF